MTVGTGGQRRKALKGKGPTPKAEERTSHPAARRARAAKQAADRPSSRGRRDGREVLVGRNPVVEALRAGVPASALYVQQYVDTDDRVREALTLATDQAMPLLEATGCHWIYANDQVWKKLQPAANWFAFKDRLGRQRPSYSDNSEAFMDHGV